MLCNLHPKGATLCFIAGDVDYYPLYLTATSSGELSSYPRYHAVHASRELRHMKIRAGRRIFFNYAIMATLQEPLDIQAGPGQSCWQQGTEGVAPRHVYILKIYRSRLSHSHWTKNGKMTGTQADRPKEGRISTACSLPLRGTSVVAPPIQRFPHRAIRSFLRRSRWGAVASRLEGATKVLESICDEWKWSRRRNYVSVLSAPVSVKRYSR
jgi:hypothetical protein